MNAFARCGLALCLGVLCGVAAFAARMDERCGAAAAPPPAAADAPTPADEPAEPAVFAFATDVLGGKTTLSNGVEVTPSDWPTLIVAKIPRPNTPPERTPTCTGTLVGPNVILFAAHCVDNPLGTRPRKATLALPGGAEAELRCEIHPAYLKREPKFFDARGSEDFALCLVDYHGPLPPRLRTMQFDVVDTQRPAQAGTAVLMSGYGCSELRIVDGALDYSHEPAILRIGNAVVDQPADLRSEQPTYLSIRSAQGLTPAVCPGDSGAPLFSHASVLAPDSGRRIIGVNSSVAVARRQDGAYDIISRIAATGNKTFHDWAKAWLNRNKGDKPVICGLNAEPGRRSCRA
ncbi:trypsin-like serine peptidase [Tahibacter harae]|uniref:S1 family peptidase n=1 Tax=Tahibacter harae TaxID=2963937 RepID=A0ABT1QT63_9GAMM|nr:trypsin-like serine protease [Tahibacter harae]MCQ4165487.1 S1 family peptidase [Tahibacter harae]